MVATRSLADCQVSPCTGSLFARLHQSIVGNAALRDELLALAQADQEARKPGPGNAVQMRIVDERNLARLKDIVQQHGFPTISLVGNEGASAAWLLAQHADADREFQKWVLAVMEQLVPIGEASMIHAAYLHDRTHTPQRYGTQGRCVGQGGWKPLEIEDPEQVDRRRAELGLPPMATYIASMNALQDSRQSSDLWGHVTP